MTREEKQKAIDVLKISAPVRAVTQEEFNDYIQILNKIMNWLEQEPCEDAISREPFTDSTICEGFSCNECSFNRKNEGGCILEERVKALPSVTPAEKVGRWIEKDGYDGDTYYDCSECGESWATVDGTPWNNGMKYCPNCGAKMVEQQESEDKK